MRLTRFFLLIDGASSAAPPLHNGSPHPLLGAWPHLKEKEWIPLASCRSLMTQLAPATIGTTDELRLRNFFLPLNKTLILGPDLPVIRVGSANTFSQRVESL